MLLTVSTLMAEYTAALSDFTRGGGEQALMRAYELGRRAVAGGLGVLELAAIHQEALAQAVADAPQPSQAARVARTASRFFAESLSAFEITHRGFIEDYPRVGQLQRELTDSRAELAALRADLERLARAAGHDLMEAPRKILSFGDLLRAHEGNALDPMASNCLGRMLGAAERMSRAVAGLRRYAKAASRREPFESVDLRALAHEALADLELKISHAGGRLEIGRLPVLTADPVLVAMALQELVENALNFRGSEPLCVRVFAERAGGAWVVVVRDNGVGVSPEETDSLFIPFQKRGDAATTWIAVGLGVCRRIAEHHGGRIWVESQPGRGSEFRVAFPAPPDRPDLEEPSHETR